MNADTILKTIPLAGHWDDAVLEIGGEVCVNSPDREPNIISFTRIAHAMKREADQLGDASITRLHLYLVSRNRPDLRLPRTVANTREGARKAFLDNFDFTRIDALSKRFHTNLRKKIDDQLWRIK